MTERLRVLERRFSVRDSVAAEVRLLAERVRRGDLDPRNLALAAHVGNSAACAALGASPSRAPLEGLVSSLTRWGREACIRAAVAAARCALPAHARVFTFSTQYHDTLAAADAWLLSGGRSSLPSILTKPERGGVSAIMAASSVLRVAQAIHADPRHLKARQRSVYRTELEITGRFSVLASLDALHAVPEARIRHAIKRELVAWYLRGAHSL